ncbi:MAG: hypothetical protein FJ125_12985 [Deltaproteobacteria bacterium]|nr:hypothetical protein [Deltaproteobacteria bacterium]
MAGWLWQAGSEGRSLLSRAEEEARSLQERLASLASLPREELDRLCVELKERCGPEAAQLQARLETLGRLRQLLATFLASHDLERLRRQAAALEFRIRSIEERLAVSPGDARATPESRGR